VNHAMRSDLYRQIEILRCRPLITYVTSSRPNAQAHMALDAVPHIVDQLEAIPEGETAIDILIVSQGGDPMVPWRIMSILRERFDRVGVLLPYAAYSAATVLALGADEIMMHPYSNLGPVDPQLTWSDQDPSGQTRHSMGTEDLRHYLEFVKQDVGITDQAQLEKALSKACEEVGVVRIGQAKRTAQLMLSMGERLLSLHIPDGNKAKTIAEQLNRSYYHHGYPLSPTEAKEVGLPVKTPEPELRDLIWAVWQSFDAEMETTRPFNPIELAMGTPEMNKLLAQAPYISIPVNLPPPLREEAIKLAMSQIRVVELPTVQYNLLHAAIESPRRIVQFRSQGVVAAARMADMQVQFSVTPTTQGWTVVEVEGNENAGEAGGSGQPESAGGERERAASPQG
jgi:hypothetical protein